MRKAPGAVQPCCGEGDGPGVMRFIPPQNRVCFVGCRACRVTHGMCAGTSSSNDICRLCIARRFSAHTLSSYFWFISYLWVVARWRATGRDAQSRRRTTVPRRKKRRTRRDVLHTTQKEGSVRRTMLECSSGVELVLRSWHCVVINAHLASGTCLSSANPRLGHLHPSLGAAPAATRHGDCFYFSIASRQVISPALSPAIHSNNEWTCNKKVLKGFERDFCRLAQVSGSVKPR